MIESRTTRLFPRTRSAIVHFLAPTYARPVGCRRRNEIGEKKFQGCHALGKVRRGVRGCLTKGMDKFYAETVKRVSSGKVSLDAGRGQRGNLYLERRNDPGKSSTLTASENISIVTHAFLEEKNVSMYMVGSSLSPARASTRNVREKWKPGAVVSRGKRLIPPITLSKNDGEKIRTSTENLVKLISRYPHGSFRAASNGVRDCLDWKQVSTWPSINRETERERLWMLPTPIRTSNTLIATRNTPV